MGLTIFLDIDGVLNSRTYFNSVLDIDPHNPADFLDPLACKNLHHFLNRFRCDIVLSSTWRLLHPIAEIENALAQNGLPLIFTDKTIIFDDICKTRYDEIVEYIDRIGDNSTYLVIDDDLIFEDQVTPLDHIPDKDMYTFKVDGTTGFTETDSLLLTKFGETICRSKSNTIPNPLVSTKTTTFINT